MEARNPTPIIPDITTLSSIYTPGYAPSNLSSNTHMDLNREENIGSHEYCLMMDKEVLGLVNDVENDKLEKENFSLSEKNT